MTRGWGDDQPLQQHISSRMMRMIQTQLLSKRPHRQLPFMVYLHKIMMDLRRGDFPFALSFYVAAGRMCKDFGDFFTGGMS